MDIEIVKSVTDDYCETSGPSTVTHIFLSLDKELFEIGRFYEGPHMVAETKKRLETVLEFERQLKKAPCNACNHYKGDPHCGRDTKQQ